MSDGRNLLTHSRVQCFQTCGRKHFFAYELGVRKKTKSAPLRIGTAIHRGKELLASGLTPEDAIAQALAGYDMVPLDFPADVWELEREKCFRLLHAYMHRYADDQRTVIQPEHAYFLPIVNAETSRATPNFQQAGKIDMILKLADGRLAIEETKTTGSDISDDSEYWSRLAIDSQVTRYVYAARKSGYDVKTVIYDVIRKPSIEPKQIPLLDENGFKVVLDAAGQRVFNKDGKPRESADAAKGWKLQSRTETAQEYGERLTADIWERPNFYFARKELYRSDADLNEFEQELWQQQQAIREAQKTQRWFRNTGACLRPFRCEFADLCFAGVNCQNATERLAQFPDFELVGNVNPELESEE